MLSGRITGRYLAIHLEKGAVRFRAQERRSTMMVQRIQPVDDAANHRACSRLQSAARNPCVYRSRPVVTRYFSDDTDSTAKESSEPVVQKKEIFNLGRHPPEVINDLRQQIEVMLRVPKQDKHSRGRGVVAMKNLLEMARIGVVKWPEDWEDLPKPRKYSRPFRVTELNKLLWRRHALRHGAKELEEFTDVQLGKTVFGIDTDRTLTLRQVRAILKEAWRFGKSPTLEKMSKGEHYDLEDIEPEEEE